MPVEPLLRSDAEPIDAASIETDPIGAGIAVWLSGDARQAQAARARLETVAASPRRELAIAALGYLLGEFDDAWVRLPAADPGSVLDALVRTAFDWRVGRFEQALDAVDAVTPEALEREPRLAARLRERRAYLSWFVHDDATALSAATALPATAATRLIVGEVLLFTGRPVQARTELMLALGAARAADDGPAAQEALAHAALAELQIGRWAEADTHARAALDQQQHTGNHHQAAVAHAVLAIMAAARGDHAEAGALTEAADAAAVRWWVPQTIGMTALARAAAADAKDDDAGVLAATAAFTASPLERQASRSGYAWWRALEVRALTRMMRLDDARRVLEQIRREHSAPVFGGAADLAALIAEAAGDTGSATRLVQEAIDEWPHPVAPWALSQAHLLEARLSLSAGDRGGHDGAVAMARAVQRRLGLPETHATAVATFSELSRRENDVARLAARGSTNREIADELFVSIKTVEFHMSRVLAKLGLRSRRQLRDRP